MDRFLRNAGKSALVRSVLALLIFSALACHGGSGHVAGWLTALLLGVGLGRWAALKPPQRFPLLRALGVALMLGGMGLGILREVADLEEAVLLMSLLGAVGLYLGAYLRFMSHPDVCILPE